MLFEDFDDLEGGSNHTTHRDKRFSKDIMVEIMRDPFFDGRLKDLGGEVGFDYQPLNSSIHRNRCTTCCGSSAGSAISSRYPRIKPASHPDIFNRFKEILIGFKGVQWSSEISYSAIPMRNHVDQ